MKTPSKLPEIYLHGGFGNQMFQIAAMIYTYGERNFLVNFIPENNVHNGNGLNILDTNIKDRLQFVGKPIKTSLQKRLIHLLIRLEGQSTGIQHLNIKITTCIIRKLLSFCYLNGREIISCSEVGYVSLTSTSSNPFVIGYLQSYVWLTDPLVNQIFNSIELNNTGEALEEFEKQAKQDHPLIMHIRLGDYRDNKNLGHLTDKYFINNLLKEWEKGFYKKIWIFSDEIESAKQIIPDKLKNHCVWIDEEVKDPAMIFQIMRLGKGYILSNSTFGWWAASLSHNERVEVIAPNPWFGHQMTPYKLIPDNWKQVSAH
jgi:hypothetical protein